MYMMEYFLSQHVRNGLRKQTELVFINKQKYSLWSITNPLEHYGILQQHPVLNTVLISVDKIHPSSSICCHPVICIFSSKSKTVIIIWHKCKVLLMFLSQVQTGSRTWKMHGRAWLTALWNHKSDPTLFLGWTCHPVLSKEFIFVREKK